MAPSSAAFAYPSAGSDAEAARFLLQAQLSASDAEIAAVRAQGFGPWLQAQCTQPVGPTGWDWLESKGYGEVYNPANYYDSKTPGDHMVWNQLMTAPDAPRKRMALALSEIFVVSLNGLDFSWRSHAAAHYWDTLCAHAFGNYRELLEAVTLNVAMGYYLNTKGNKKADGRGSQPDENYAREVMQLFTIGLVELLPDGTPRMVDGRPVDSYTSADVSSLAQVFTGYDLDHSQTVYTVIPQTGGGTRRIPSTHYVRRPLVQVGNNHSQVVPVVFGVTLPTDPANGLKAALDTLFNHANTAPFVCKQLIQRLVTSNPSPAYVRRVANVFSNNGAGVRGDLAAVYRAILQDDEARAPWGLGASAFGKLREPMLRLVQWGRTFGLASASGDWKMNDMSNPGSQLGQSPLRSPSVFNFFRPGYVPPASALVAGAVAPEFQLVNETSVAGYINCMQGFISGGIASGDMKASYVQELPLASSAQALVDRLNLLLCANQLSASNRDLIANAVQAMPSGTEARSRNRVYAAVLMVMSAPEYLVQK